MENIKKIAEKLEKIGKKLYIVGGRCRNFHMQKYDVSDVDLATDAFPDEMTKVLHVVKEVGKKYGTLIVKEGGDVFEITTFRSDIGILNHRKPVEVIFTQDLFLDAQRRDFCVNALYFDVQKNEWIDPVGGINDIKNNELRFVGNPEDRIQEDALRILRYVRFLFQYDFQKKSEITQILQKNIDLLVHISIERIFNEVEKIFVLQKIEAIEYLYEIGFFRVLFPEIHQLSEVPGGPPHHCEGNVWVHTCMTIEQFFIMTSGQFLFPQLDGSMAYKKFSCQEIIDGVWTLLFHDIAKYDTLSFDEEKKVHYYNHEQIGEEKFLQLALKYYFSNETKQKIAYAIKNHLRVFHLLGMRDIKAKKFMLEKYFSHTLIVSLADNLGRIPAKVEMGEKLISFYAEFLKQYSQMEFFNGREILEMYPELQGAQIKQMLQLKNDEILGGRRRKFND